METDIREKINTLIKRQYRCVLATASENRPLCSLMAYAANASCSEIYLMTLKNSRKYQNMCENPAVSILIDTRKDTPGFDHNQTMALTLSGHFDRNIDDIERERILKELSGKHPELKDFFENPEMEPVKIIVTSCLLMEGPAKAHHIEFSDL
ncbi:MAG TPA: pyridoxamine 5'-phosphate oxidase family protein [Desulfobacteraceae bacterium]|nr:pyridoxamine 5'-phosphate oxidase family protein [Desulfobacteraceae bacterium]HPJ66281.1 pyridoxamine 5'-phosphate oxidase family protein [Desulfobacteraceae bacterium]